MAFGPACSAPQTHSVPSVPMLSSAPIQSHIQFPTPTVLSIFSFGDRTGKPELAWLRTGMVDMLIAELANNPSLIIVQRERVDEIVREQAFQLSGRVTDESTVKIGRLIGANVLVTGRMIVADGLLRLDAQLIGVEQGTVLGAVSAEGRLNDVATAARLLVAKVRGLFSTPAADSLSVQSVGVQMLQTAKAEHNGEQLSREGKLFEALEEYERALSLNPNNTIAQSHVAHTLERLPPESWLNPSRTQTSRHVLNRIVERLAMSLKMDIGRPSTNVMGPDRSGLRIPVHIRLSAQIIDQTLEALKQVGGTVLQPSEQDDTTVVRFTAQPELVEALAREKVFTRRLYLRLLSAEGRTMAVYSDFRGWALSNWLMLDGSTIRIKRAYILPSEARFEELTPEQITAIASVRVTLDRVLQERATVRLDVQTAIDQPSDRESRASLSESRSERHHRATQQDKAMLESVSPLRTLMEAAWSPPVTARPWSIGYVPSNERSAVVTLSLDPTKQGIREEPRLVRPSGDTEFDVAALTAARTGLQQWLSARGFESLSRAPAMPAKEIGHPEDPLPPFKVRAQFQLHQDVPVLNLIAPHALDHALMPLLPPPALQ
jgi:TolB-like protein